MSWSLASCHHSHHIPPSHPVTACQLSLRTSVFCKHSLWSSAKELKLLMEPSAFIFWKIGKLIINGRWQIWEICWEILEIFNPDVFQIYARLMTPLLCTSLSTTWKYLRKELTGCLGMWLKVMNGNLQIFVEIEWHINVIKIVRRTLILRLTNEDAPIPFVFTLPLSLTWLA